MGNICYKDTNNYYPLNDHTNINTMESLIHKLTLGVRSLENDVKKLEDENVRIKKINRSLLSKVVEQ